MYENLYATSLAVNWKSIKLSNNSPETDEKAIGDRKIKTTRTAAVNLPTPRLFGYQPTQFWATVISSLISIPCPRILFEVGKAYSWNFAYVFRWKRGRTWMSIAPWGRLVCLFRSSFWPTLFNYAHYIGSDVQNPSMSTFLSRCLYTPCHGMRIQCCLQKWYFFGMIKALLTGASTGCGPY